MTFYYYLYYFIEAKEVDIIVGDFNIDSNPDYHKRYQNMFNWLNF